MLRHAFGTAGLPAAPAREVDLVFSCNPLSSIGGAAVVQRRACLNQRLQSGDSGRELRMIVSRIVVPEC
jgi:hypothetical protein